MERIALSWKKRKSRRAWSSTNMETSQLSAGVPISFFIVVRITIITDKKLAAAVKKFNFCQTFRVPAHNWPGPLRGSGWGFRAYIGMQRAHFRAIYSYIWKHDMRFYASGSGLSARITRFSMRGWRPSTLCLELKVYLHNFLFWKSRKCICTIWRRQKMKECFQPIQASVCFHWGGVININLTNVTSLLVLRPIPGFFI